MDIHPLGEPANDDVGIALDHGRGLRDEALGPASQLLEDGGQLAPRIREPIYDRPLLVVRHADPLH